MEAPDGGGVLARVRRERFLILLVFLVGFIALSPLYEGTPWGALLRTTVISCVVLAAIWCLQFRGRSFVAIRWLGGVTLLSSWLPMLTGLPAFFITSDAFRILFFAGLTALLIYQVAASERVTPGTIIGAVDGYLLLGFMGAAAFGIVEISSPGSVKGPGGIGGGADFVYYAFVTMTTVGYGDIVPVTAGARSLAILLAVAGQLYIAVLISLLVGKYLGSKTPPPPGQ